MGIAPPAHSDTLNSQGDFAPRRATMLLAAYRSRCGDPLPRDQGKPKQARELLGTAGGSNGKRSPFTWQRARIDFCRNAFSRCRSVPPPTTTFDARPARVISISKFEDRVFTNDNTRSAKLGYSVERHHRPCIWLEATPLPSTFGIRRTDAPCLLLLKIVHSLTELPVLQIAL